MHHYEFTIWALPSAEISLDDDEKATTLTELLSERALARANTSRIGECSIELAAAALRDQTNRCQPGSVWAMIVDKDVRDIPVHWEEEGN